MPQFISKLDAIPDVDAASPDIGDVLQWNGTKWESGPVVSASVSLNDLSDVTITSPSSGQVVRYNGTSWVNASIAVADIDGLVDALDGKSNADHTHAETEITNRKGIIWTTSFDVTLSPSGTSGTLMSACPYTLNATDRVMVTAHVVPTVNEGSYASIGIDGNYGLWQAALLAGSSAGCVTRSTLFRSPITSQIGGFNSYWTAAGAGSSQHGFIAVGTMDLLRTTLRLRGDGMSGGTMRVCGWIEVIR